LLIRIQSRRMQSPCQLPAQSRRCWLSRGNSLEMAGGLRLGISKTRKTDHRSSDSSCNAATRQLPDASETLAALVLSGLTAISTRKSHKRLRHHEHSSTENSDPGRRFPPGIVNPEWTSNLRCSRRGENMVFRTFEIPSLSPRVGSKPMSLKIRAFCNSEAVGTRPAKTRFVCELHSIICTRAGSQAPKRPSLIWATNFGERRELSVALRREWTRACSIERP
jgi:hypothetical protein